MSEILRITLNHGVITNEGPTGRAAEGDTIDMKAIHARELVSQDAAFFTTDPVETKAEKAARKAREASEEGKFDAEEKIIADQQARADALKANPNISVEELQAVTAAKTENK